MARGPAVGAFVSDLSTISPSHRPTTDAARRIPSRELPSARTSKSGLRWCATDNTVLDPDKKETFCDGCRLFRDAWKKRQKRLLKEDVITLHRPRNDEIVEAAEQLEAVVRQLAAARSREGADDKKVDALQSAVYERTLVLTDLIGQNLYAPRGRAE